LLLYAHLSQDSVDRVQVEWQQPIIAAHSHQAEHALGVRVSFANPQRLDFNIGKGMICALKGR
jgi:hypothetical protein